MEHQKEDPAAAPTPQTAVQTLSFKVNLKCCNKCEENATRGLKKINGVDSVKFNGNGVVTISGTVDPKKIVERFAKWDKKAKLLPLKEGNSPFCSSKAVSDCSDEDSDDDIRKSVLKNPQLSQIPMGNQNPQIPVQKQSTEKKGRSFPGFLCGLLKGRKKSAPIPMMREDKWGFPPPGMSGPPKGYQLNGHYPQPQGYGSAWGYSREQQPYFQNPGMEMQPYWDGMYGYREPSYRDETYGYRVNPMVHYSDYRDNYGRR